MVMKTSIRNTSQRGSAAASRKRNQGTAAAERQERFGTQSELQTRIDQSVPVVIQRRQIERVFGARQQPNNTGLPDNLKTGIESLSGVDLSDVRVQRNSTKPAQLNALAYTQGNEIYLGPGQERHLPHEAWHAVQQKQDRVRPTMRVNGASINDDHMLEKEADKMGTRSNWMRAVEGRRSRSQFLTSQKGPYGTALSHDAKPIQDVIQGFWPFTGYGYFWNIRPDQRTPEALIAAARAGNIEGITCHQAVLTWLRESGYASDETRGLAHTEEALEAIYNNRGPGDFPAAREAGEITVPAGHIIGFFGPAGELQHSMVAIDDHGNWAGFNNHGTWGIEPLHAIIDAAAYEHWIEGGNTLSPAGGIGAAAPLTVVHLPPDAINPAYQGQP